MSSKTGPDAPRAWSLAARLTAWYAGSAFLLVLSATGFLYWALAHNFDREDDEFLTEKVRAVQGVLESQLEGEARRREIERLASQDAARILVRVGDVIHNIKYQTPGMADIVPAGAFSSAASDAANYKFGRDNYRNPAGR